MSAKCVLVLAVDSIVFHEPSQDTNDETLPRFQSWAYHDLRRSGWINFCTVQAAYLTTGAIDMQEVSIMPHHRKGSGDLSTADPAHV